MTLFAVFVVGWVVGYITRALLERNEMAIKDELEALRRGFRRLKSELEDDYEPRIERFEKSLDALTVRVETESKAKEEDDDE